MKARQSGRARASPRGGRHHAAGDARAATAQRGGVVGMVVAARMHHEGTALDVGELQARRQHRRRGATLGIDVERGQVAQVAVAPWRAMACRALRVVMPTRSSGRNAPPASGGVWCAFISKIGVQPFPSKR